MPSPKIDFSQTSLSEKGILLKTNPCYDIQKDEKILRVPSCLKVSRASNPYEAVNE